MGIYLGLISAAITLFGICTAAFAEDKVTFALSWIPALSRDQEGQRRVLSSTTMWILPLRLPICSSRADMSAPRCMPPITPYGCSWSFIHVSRMIDIRLGRECGVDVLPRLLTKQPELICIMITAHADMQTAISALRLGAYDYYEKSFDPAELYAILDRAFEKRELRRQALQSQEQPRERKLQLDTALNNMSQGLCMFDAAARLVVCNARYREMYGLSPDMVKPGTSLLDLLN